MQKREEKGVRRAKGSRRRRGKKGKSKGDGKGCGKSGEGFASANQKGKPICFAFNDTNTRCRKKQCRFMHVCGICFANNVPMFDCGHQGGGGDKP